MRRVMRRGWKVIAAGTGLLMLATAIGTLGVQAQTDPQPDPWPDSCPTLTRQLTAALLERSYLDPVEVVPARPRYQARQLEILTLTPASG